MVIGAPAAADKPLAGLWSLAFRPFFLAAAVWAALALALWTVVFMTGGVLPSRFDPLTWHIHAMLFGFVFAAVAGFMLTAIPTWTGRPPIHGGPLAGLVALWLLGRIACLVSAFLPLWLAAAVDLAFPFVLCAIAAREIVAARNWRNLIMPLPIGVLGIADLLMYLQLASFSVPAGTRMAPRYRRCHRPHFRRRRTHHSRLHAQLAGKARRLGASGRRWPDRPCRARHAPYRPSRLGVVSDLATGWRASGLWRRA